MMVVMKRLLCAFLVIGVLGTFAAILPMGSFLSLGEPGLTPPIAEAAQPGFLSNTRGNTNSGGSSGSSGGLQEFFYNIGYTINFAVIPLLLSIALLFFLYHIFSLYINKGNIEKRDEAKRHALWGALAFIVIASIWGIVNLLVGGFEFDREEALCPDL